MKEGKRWKYKVEIEVPEELLGKTFVNGCSDYIAMGENKWIRYVSVCYEWCMRNERTGLVECEVCCEDPDIYAMYIEVKFNAKARREKLKITIEKAEDEEEARKQIVEFEHAEPLDMFIDAMVANELALFLDAV